MKDYVSIYLDNSRFYVIDRDIVILHFLLHYRIDKDYKIYFNDIDYVKNILDKNHVNYMVNNVLYSFDDNRYFNIYSNANNKVKLYYMIKEIKNKINILDTKEKIELLERLNDLLDER